MLDNKILPEFVREALADTSYQEMVRQYDKNCSQCSFNLLRIVKNGKKLHEGHNTQDAIQICLDIEGSQILRLCTFGGEEHSVSEIVKNTCRLWNTPEYDESVFIEVDDIDDLRLDAWLAKVGDLDVELTMADMGLK